MSKESRFSEYDKKTRKQIAGMTRAERRAIKARQAASVEQEECECKDGMFPTQPTSRRGFLVAAAGGAASLVATAATAKAPPGAIEYPVQADPTKEQGRLTSDDGGYGSRSQFENEVRWRFPTKTKESSWTMTPLDKGEGVITPSGLHFERHHGGIPNINPDSHRLMVHGMCKNPKVYTMADLKRFPSVSKFHFIECSGNGLTEWAAPWLKTVQGTHGLTSMSEWTGVPLASLLREVGMEPGAAWILGEGSDAAMMTRSVPIDKALTDALVVYAQNGEALRPEQGYPLRLVLPGFEGNTHIKWLRRLKISDKPFMTREETSKYTDTLGNGLSRQFTLTMEAKSVITYPSGEMKLPGAGFYEITGLAWTGRGKVKRVEVSVDGGKTWGLAALQEPIMSIAHTRFRFPWMWDGKPAILQSRCQDETGYIQPTIKELRDVRGMMNSKIGSIYHLNGIQSWAVAEDGSVKNVHQY